MILHHTVNLGWGYAYFVDAAASITFTDDTASSACGPNLIQNVNTNTHINCNSNYTVGMSSFLTKYGGGGGLDLIQDVHDSEDHHWPVNTKFVTLHASAAMRCSVR